MEELIQAMSIPELEVFKKTYKDNESVCKVIEGYIEVKVATEAQAKAQEAFGKAIGKMADKLPHPDNVHNVYLAWQEVEEEDTTQKVSIVTITDEPPVMGDGGKIVTEAVTHQENRYPMVKVHRWVVTLNKGFTVNRSGSGNGSATNTSSRAVSVKAIEGDKVVLVGTARSCEAICKHLNLGYANGEKKAQGSGRVRLQQEGYIVEDYNGSDYTIE